VCFLVSPQASFITGQVRDASLPTPSYARTHACLHARPHARSAKPRAHPRRFCGWTAAFSFEACDRRSLGSAAPSRSLVRSKSEFLPYVKQHNALPVASTFCRCVRVFVAWYSERRGCAQPPGKEWRLASQPSLALCTRHLAAWRVPGVRGTPLLNFSREDTRQRAGCGHHGDVSSLESTRACVSYWIYPPIYLPSVCLLFVRVGERSSLPLRAATSDWIDAAGMNRLGMPLMVINLGGEMMYILEQRLVAQKIQPEKARKVCPQPQASTAKVQRCAQPLG
jgi:hypothetical protein